MISDGLKHLNIEGLVYFVIQDLFVLGKYVVELVPILDKYCLRYLTLDSNHSYLRTQNTLYLFLIYYILFF